MQYQISRKKDVLIVSVCGEIDHHTTGRLRDNIDIEIMKNSTGMVIFDFSKVDMMDSSGIGMIMGRYRLIRSSGGKIAIAGAPCHINKIIRLSGLGNITIITDSVEKALA